MTQHHNIDVHLDREASPLERARFSRHAEGCSDCQRQLATWRHVQAVLSEEIEAASIPPSPEKVARFIARASAGETVSTVGARGGKALYYLAAAAALLALGSVLLFFTRSHEPAPAKPPVAVSMPSVEEKGDRSRATDLPRIQAFLRAPPREPGPWLEENATVTLGGHVMRVRAGARARIERNDEGATDILLERGSLSLSAAPRRKNHDFAIKALPYRIRVVGTVFEVDYAPNERLDVLVAEGIVEVLAPRELPVRVTAGQRLRVDRDRYVELQEGDRKAVAELLSTREVSEERPKHIASPKHRVWKGRHRPAAVEPVPSHARCSMNELRRMVLERRFQEAEQGLMQVVEADPQHATAWSLLGDCRRKQGRWAEALAAYRKVIEGGEPSQSNRARYLAGVLAQDNLVDHLQAEALFEAYLFHSNGASEDAVKIRLARSKIALAKRPEARRLLAEVIARSRDIPSRERARKLLDSLR